jgi:hypothetical protein
MPDRERVLTLTRDVAPDDQLREAFAARSELVALGDACPSADLIWQAVQRELPRHRIRAIGLHAIECPACAEAWRLAADLMRESADRAGEPPKPARVVPLVNRGWARGALAAAAAILLFAVVFPLRTLVVGPSEEGPLRGGEEIILLETAADRPIPREGFTLRWAGPPGTHYDVRVATDDLSVIVEVFDLEATELHLPEERLAELPSGTRIVWQVRASLPDGRRVASRTFVQTLE